ncbi:hypothetical protein JQC67_14260 [Aurantibacter crassamenti]|uniref:hypothetical protein n=1 Tax=Aurantibacter crassamenti TaxID=1837375 RepID=UPI00193AAC5A|nr:hypothetical protein [Aurantibacter crassamenti]MBM1107315.1 hypothetical protein [Aurantibacter crassamenti]
MQKSYWINFLILIVINFSLSAQNTIEKPKITGFVDFNGYYDTREFSVLTYNILANVNRFQYFSLTNYKSGKQSFDFETNYAEHNLRYSLSKTSPLDVTLQYVMRNGADNDDFRFGLRARLQSIKKLSSFFKKLNMSYSINPMFIQFRRNAKTKYMSIIEHVYRINISPKTFKNRLYLGGFIDQNFSYLDNGGVVFKYVSEHQLGFRLINQLYAILEFRINDFLSDENYGLGYGLEYKIVF